MKEKIYVTRPSLPPLEEFLPYLEKIWDSKWLSNNGPFHQQFEEALCEYLGVKYVSLFANGTLALMTALQVLRITGEVITTPYSFVATTHSVHWNGIKPVFCDIESEYMTLDAEKIEAQITPKTTALLPVHVYGNPCNVARIQEIADVYGLKVIYDAAHAFGVKIKDKSILNFGDLSILSFHPTKIFNTFEGGAIICHDKKTKKRIDYLKNFGFASETTVVAPGINGKMNEIQSSFGLLQLKYIDQNIKKRGEISKYYKSELKNVEGISCLKDNQWVKHNYSYLPILVDEKTYGLSRDALYEKLKQNNIFARRYFYPLISSFSTYKGLESAKKKNLPVAEKIAQQIICLPVYPEMGMETLEFIVKLIKSVK